MPSVEEENSGVVVEDNALLTLSGLFSVVFVVVVVAVVAVAVPMLDASAAAVSVSISGFCGLLSDDNVTWSCMDALACVLSAI